MEPNHPILSALTKLLKNRAGMGRARARHLKAELKRADVTYHPLAERLKEHGFSETKASIANKLARATIPASFFLACLAALELKGVRLEDI